MENMSFHVLKMTVDKTNARQLSKCIGKPEADYMYRMKHMSSETGP